MSEDHLETDVLIVGAGVAGLSAAIRLAQDTQTERHIMVLEKGASVGAHILSGAVFDPKALNTLLPQWKDAGAPLRVPAKRDRFYRLTRRKAWRLPVPRALSNHGNYIISLGELCAWLAEQAEALGVEIYPGFAAASLLFDDENRVVGVKSQDQGRGKDGEPTANFEPGVNLFAKTVFLAEGCRGHLSEQVMERYTLRPKHRFQTYGLGIKEIWEVDPRVHEEGTIVHTVGFPLDKRTYGGGFLYHWDQHRVLAGFVSGLDYQDPHFSPYDAFQGFKSHPAIERVLSTGRVVRYGARALNEGGWQSLPTLTFPGGALLGCAAGMVNVPRIKGSHLAMQSGIEAADALIQQRDYNQAFRKSWAGVELYRARNIRPAFQWGMTFGMLYSGLDLFIFRQRTPWTWQHHRPDHLCLKPASPKHQAKPFAYDGKLTYPRLQAHPYSNTFHEEDQPSHLKLRDDSKPLTVNLPTYDGPEGRYCPANVYEYLDDGGKPRFQINAANCLHCKACSIKDPSQNIQWVVPEGGGGPQYGDM